MSKENKYWINNHNTNIVIINSGDGNYRIGTTSDNSNQMRNENPLKDPNVELRTIVDVPSLEDSEEKSNKTQSDMLPLEASSLFHRLEGHQLKNKSIFGNDKEKNIFDMNMERKRGRGEELFPLSLWKKNSKFSEGDPSPESEQFSMNSQEVNVKRIPLNDGGTGVTGQIAPTLGYIPLGDNRPSTYSIGDEFKLNSDMKTTSKILDSYKKLPSQSPTHKPQRSSSTPDLALELQKKLIAPQKDAHPDNSVSKSNNSIVDEPTKNDNSLNVTAKTEKAKLFDKIGIFSSLKKLGSKNQLSMSGTIDNRIVSQLDLSQEKPRKSEDEGGKESSKANLPLKGASRLLNIILKHASSGDLTKEAEIFNRVMKRIQPERLKNIHAIKHRRFAKIFQRIKKFVKSGLYYFIKLHQPDETFIIIWNIIGVMLVILNCFYVPFEMSFYFDSRETQISLIINLYFAANILIRFRTGYYSRGLLITDQKQVFYQNLNFSLVLEVLSVFAGTSYLLADVDSLKYLTFFTLVRVRHIQGFVGKIEDHSNFRKEISGLFKLIWLILTILTIAHLSGCVFYMIAAQELAKNPDNWLVLYSDPNESILARYTASLYWAFATMITVGYGDIVPSTTNERIYTIFIMAVACGVFGYGVNTIQLIFEEINGHRTAHRQKIRQITNYMKRKHLSRAVQVRVRKYLEYILEGERTHRVEEQEILKMLSLSLQNEVLIELNVKALRDCKLFAYSFTQKFLNSLAKDLKEITLSPEEVIFQERDEEDKSIYFISTGKINIFYQKCDKVLKTLTKGDFFGEISFFSNLPRSAGAKSVNFTSVYCLTREKFIEVSHNFPQDREQFLYIQDKFIFENNTDLLRMICYCCREEGHLASDCPKVHLCVESKSKIIDAHLKEETAFRKSYKRRTRARFSPLSKLQTLSSDAAQLRSALGNVEAVLLQTQENEKFGFIPNEANPMESIDSVENLSNFNNKNSLGATLQPPNQMNRSPSRDNSNLLGHELARSNSQLARQSSIANGIIGNQGIMPRGSRQQLPGQNSLNPEHNPSALRLRFDIVENFEIYYPHGNITVISKKYNVLAGETMVALTIERRTGKKINRNILKGIDILSGGSIYGALKKSSESLVSLKSPVRRKTLRDSELILPKNNSFSASNRVGSSFNVASGESNQADTKRKQLGLSQHGSTQFLKKEGSLFLNPERLNESSLVSSSSVILHPVNDVVDPIASKRRPSRFGPASLQTSKITSSNVGSDSHKASNSNLLALHDDRTASYGPSSFATDNNVASSILPRSNEPESSSNNNLINFWRERERSKTSFQRSDMDLKSGSGSFASPRFRKSSVEDSRPNHKDSRVYTDSLGDDDSKSQSSLLYMHRKQNNKPDETGSSRKYSSDKKIIQSHLRRALQSLKENSGSNVSDRKILQKRSRFSQKAKGQRPSSVGKESKLSKIIKKQGFSKTLKDIVVIIQSDRRLYSQNIFTNQNADG